jgi:hypothetical protein
MPEATAVVLHEHEVVPAGIYTDTPAHRYQRDPAFKQLVDAMTRSIQSCQFSPSELREAAVLAAVHYELRWAVPPVLAQDTKQILKGVKR